MRRTFATAIAPIAAAAVMLTGCYHATIDTGRAPSTEQIVQPWASSFIYGLVPPPVVETSQRCRNGVAKVETQHSFLNSLVGSLTFGIYTPMTIVVTCANATAVAPGAKTLEVGNAGTNEAAKTFEQAIELADKTGKAVYLTF